MLFYAFQKGPMHDTAIATILYRFLELRKGIFKNKNEQIKFSLQIIFH